LTKGRLRSGDVEKMIEDKLTFEERKEVLRKLGTKREMRNSVYMNLGARRGGFEKGRNGPPWIMDPTVLCPSPFPPTQLSKLTQNHIFQPPVTPMFKLANQSPMHQLKHQPLLIMTR